MLIFCKIKGVNTACYSLLWSLFEQERHVCDRETEADMYTSSEYIQKHPCMLQLSRLEGEQAALSVEPHDMHSTAVVCSLELHGAACS